MSMNVAGISVLDEASIDHVGGGWVVIAAIVAVGGALIAASMKLNSDDSTTTCKTDKSGTERCVTTKD